jgi:hypothetical protein
VVLALGAAPLSSLCRNSPNRDDPMLGNSVMQLPILKADLTMILFDGEGTRTLAVAMDSSDRIIDAVRCL